MGASRPSRNTAQIGETEVPQGAPLSRKGHRRVKIVRVEFERLGLFGRVVASIFALLAIGAVFLFSVALFVSVAAFATVAVLYALWVTRRSGKGRVIEGELDRVDMNSQRQPLRIQN